MRSPDLPGAGPAPAARSPPPGRAGAARVWASTTGLVTIAFLAAIERIPLGTAVAVEFLGPLTVAAVRSHSRRALTWPALALLGVVLLTEPWHGAINPAGLGFAGPRRRRVGHLHPAHPTHRRPLHGHRRALTHRPHRRCHGGGRRHPAGRRPPHPRRPRRRGRAGRSCCRSCPSRSRLLALRRMTPTAFGTLMALEPAIGVLLGLLVLHQKPSTRPAGGILLVVLAGAGAQRGWKTRASGPTTAPGSSSKPDLIG